MGATIDEKAIPTSSNVTVYEDLGGFYDELDHLVRDAYMPDDKKAGAIAKLVGHYFEPKGRDAIPGCARCAEIERVAMSELQVIYAWALGLCRNKGVEPTTDEHPVKVFIEYRDALAALGCELGGSRKGIPE